MSQVSVKPEMLVGVSAVLIGLCALGVSLYETSLMREEQRAAVLPILELTRSYYWDQSDSAENKSRLSLHSENVGIGPARVLDFKVTVDGEAMATWGAALQALTGTDEHFAYGQSTINGRIIPADRLIKMMDLGQSEWTEKLLVEFDRLDFEACYCSIFNQCWTSSYSQFGDSTEVVSCQRSDDSFSQ